MVFRHQHPLLPDLGDPSVPAEANGKYHSNWLNMIYPRLKLARNLLKENGVMVVNNDDPYAKEFIKDNSVTLGYKDDSDLKIEESFVFLPVYMAGLL